MLLFMPVFRKFTAVVLKCCKVDGAGAVEFYTQGETLIAGNLAGFLDELPLDLAGMLHLFYRLVRVNGAGIGVGSWYNMKMGGNINSMGNNNMNMNMGGNINNTNNSSQAQTQTPTQALSSVKKLLVYSLLVRSDLIEGYLANSEVGMAKYEETCNYLLNLFFTSSLKKYHHPHPTIHALTHLISAKIDRIILSGTLPGDDNLNPNAGMASKYVIEEPILNHDYEVLWERISKMDFTPKDEKEFDLKTIHSIDSLYINLIKEEGPMPMDYST